MALEFDASKRNKTLLERGFDFARAADVFAGPTFHWIDKRRDYHEERHINFGVLDGRWVIVAWTPRGEVRRIISMRYANDREIAKYCKAVGGP